MNQSFDWTNHILNLTDLPPLVELWEQELVAELEHWIQSHIRSAGAEIQRTRYIGWFPPTLAQIASGKVHRYLPWLPQTSLSTFRRKWFEHSVTADDILIIARRK